MVQWCHCHGVMVADIYIYVMQNSNNTYVLLLSGQRTTQSFVTLNSFHFIFQKHPVKKNSIILLFVWEVWRSHIRSPNSTDFYLVQYTLHCYIKILFILYFYTNKNFKYRILVLIIKCCSHCNDSHRNLLSMTCCRV